MGRWRREPRWGGFSAGYWNANTTVGLVLAGAGLVYGVWSGVVVGLIFAALGAWLALRAFKGISTLRAIAWLVIEGGIGAGAIALLYLLGVRGFVLLVLMAATVWVSPAIATRVTGVAR